MATVIIKDQSILRGEPVSRGTRAFLDMRYVTHYAEA